VLVKAAAYLFSIGLAQVRWLDEYKNASFFAQFLF
jgi:hypothetical protein